MDVRTEFIHNFGVEPVLSAHAPASVKLLGEHVDYNHGPVLTIALDRSVTIAVAPRDDDIITLNAYDLDEQVTFHLSSLEGKTDRDGVTLPEWARYPAGIAWAIQDAGLEVPGLNAVYWSDIPVGIGMGSSVALAVGIAAAWESLGDWSLEKKELALLCQRAQDEYVGVKSGWVGQISSIFGVKGHTLYFDTQTLEIEALPLIPKTAILVADPGMRRDLTNSAYLERIESCVQAVDLLREYLPEIRSLRDVSPTEMAAYSYFLPPVVKSRAEHVIREIARVKSAVSALKRADARALGALMYSSHTSLRNLYETSTPELDALVDIARETPGCLGAHLTGKGFGGCTINLVEEARVEEFETGLKRRYFKKTGLDPALYIFQASDGVTVDNL